MTLGGVCCSVYESERVCARLRHYRRRIRFLFMENSVRTHAPLAETAGGAPRSWCPCLPRRTPRSPASGRTFNRGPPCHPPQQRPGPDAESRLGRGNLGGARLLRLSAAPPPQSPIGSDTGCATPGPKHPGSPARAPAQPFHPGAGAGVGVSEPSSPPLGPLSRRFPSSPPLWGPRAHPGLAGRRRLSPTWVLRDSRAAPAKLRCPLRGLRPAREPEAHVSAGVGFPLALGLSGRRASRTLPFQAPPAPSLPRRPR